MESYIDCKKKLYDTILEFLEESDGVNEQIFAQFCDKIRKFQIEGDREEMTQFLLIIKSISDHHHRDMNFIAKIQKILQQYQEQIKQTLSNDEIFHLFENNKLIVHFLLKNNIINISESIYNYIVNIIEPNGNRYCYFFYPELEQFKGEEEMKSIKEELLKQNPTAFNGFESKRQEGQNDSYICSLIRNDSVEEFIAYINRQNISVLSEITPSIYETNLFLNEKEHVTFIEYSAFFGSIQIFQYLLMNNAELTPSLLLYSIHSGNAELFHILESYHIIPPFYNSERDEKKEEEEEKEKEASHLSCLIESIKCHHNDFAEYIKDNLIQEQENETTTTKEEILFNSMKYHNYSYFKTELIKEKSFFYLCLYDYKKLVEFLLKEKEEEIKKKIIQLKYYNEKMISTFKIL